MSTSGAYRAPAGPRIERATGVTDGNGSVTFAWPAGAFTAPPVVTLAVEGASGSFRTVRISANSAASTTAQVTGAAVVELLGIQLLAAALPAAGVTVHAHAIAT